MVEGGAFTLNEFIKHNLYDEIHRFKSKNLRLTNGDLAPEIKANLVPTQELPSDFYEVFKNTSSL